MIIIMTQITIDETLNKQIVVKIWIKTKPDPPVVIGAIKCPSPYPKVWNLLDHFTPARFAQQGLPVMRYHLVDGKKNIQAKGFGIFYVHITLKCTDVQYNMV